MYVKEGQKPLDNIRVEAVKVQTYLINDELFYEDIKTGLHVRLSQNLDNYTDSEGNTCYLREGETYSPEVIEHRGITKLKSGIYSGQYVITQEILKAGEKRRKSLRRAIIVTDAEALDYVMRSGKLDILEKERFAPLKVLCYRQQAPVDWENVKAPEEVEKQFCAKDVMV